MAKKRSVSLSAEAESLLEKAVAEGVAENVSAFLSEAVVEYFDPNGFLKMLDLYDEAHGAPTEEDIKWAEEIMALERAGKLPKAGDFVRKEEGSVA